MKLKLNWTDWVIEMQERKKKKETHDLITSVEDRLVGTPTLDHGRAAAKLTIGRAAAKLTIGAR